MLSPKVAIVKAITLLTLERRIGGDLSTELVKDIIEFVPNVDDASVSDLEKEAYFDTHALMIELARTKKEDFPHEEDILQRCKVACKNDPHLYDSIFDVLKNDKYVPEEEASVLALSTRRTLENCIKSSKADKIIDTFYQNYRFRKGSFNYAAELDKLTEQCRPYVSATDTSGPDETQMIDFSKPSNIKRVLEIAEIKGNTEGILRTGWQCMNRMFGCGGIKRGEDIIFSALPYSYKSGMVLNLFAQLPHFNEPYLFDRTKKPAIVFITLENDLDNNIRILYRTIYENINKVKLEGDIDLDEAAAFINTFFEEKGYTCIMCKFVGQDLTAARLINWLKSLQKQGYELAALFIDYLALMSKEGIYSTFTGQDLTLLYQKVANFTRDNFIALVTPHQLSSQAQEVKREAGEGFAERVSGKGYYDGSKRLAQEPSFEGTLDKIDRRDSSYLVCVRGKHRTEMLTPAKHRKWAMKFQEVGTLPWDVDGEDLSVDLDANMFDSDFDTNEAFDM